MCRNYLPLFLSAFFLFGLMTGRIQFGDDEVPTPKVYLNHFYLLLNSSTYKDVVESDFIKNEFSHFEERTTIVNAGESYSGAYIYGENTYFEFFDESQSQESMTMGVASAIAFGVEKKEEIKIIQEKLKENKNAVLALRTREYERIQVRRKIPFCPKCRQRRLLNILIIRE